MKTENSKAKYSLRELEDYISEEESFSKHLLEEGTYTVEQHSAVIGRFSDLRFHLGTRPERELTK